MSCFSGVSLLNRGEISALEVALSLALGDGLGEDDLNALGNLLSAVGSMLSTFASLKPPCGALNGQEDKKPQDKK